MIIRNMIHFLIFFVLPSFFVYFHPFIIQHFFFAIRMENNAHLE